jgi:hypothetical protein
VIVQGFAIKDASGGCPSVVDLCLPIRVRSMDFGGFSTLPLEVGLDIRSVDFNDFTEFISFFPPQPYNTCADYNQDGSNDLTDLSEFALHFGTPDHGCR